MPGVPTGRACEGCRKQKKKTLPSCSRCTRLGIPCIGSGQRRFQFKEEHRFALSEGKYCQKQRKQQHGIQNEEIIIMAKIPLMLNNEMTSLANSFLATIKPSTDLRFNLAWSYGIFLEEIPKRLGYNGALDTSVSALVCAHSDLCSRQKVSVESLNKYSLALKTLRLSLDTPATACSIETLCAVMLLLICQGFLGITDNTTTSAHSEGAAQILKARRFYNPKDSFESSLIASLRGPVVIHGLFSDKIHLTPSEWKYLVENHLDGVSAEGRLMRYLARIPNIMERGRLVRKRHVDDQEMLHDARSDYQAWRTDMKELHDSLEEAKVSRKSVGACFTLQAYYERIYGFSLAVGIILNCVLSAIDVEDTALSLEVEEFSASIIELSGPAKRYRPLWSGYMVTCLMAAWIGTTDSERRLWIEGELEDYRYDFPQRSGPRTSMPVYLEKIYRHLHLLD